MRHTRRILAGLAALAVLAATGAGLASYIVEDESSAAPARDIPAPRRPPPPHHVPELAAVLDRLELHTPRTSHGLAVTPLTLRGKPPLPGPWLALDAAIKRNLLEVTEKESAQVPTVLMVNRSRADHILVVAGEVITGGKQTRTVRRDVVLAPGQRVPVPVFCVEARRWRGQAAFGAGEMLVPQSILKRLRADADQEAVWAEVARNNAALGTENATRSLEQAVKAGPVKDKLAEVRRAILPEVPDESVGFIFARGGEALGLELFGRPDLARALLPKLLDAYAVDVVLVAARPDVRREAREPGPDDDLLDWVRAAGSRRAETLGSGAGIVLSAPAPVGSGVSLDGDLVHFGAQVAKRIVPPVAAPRPHDQPRPSPARGGRRRAHP